ncbi:MAG: hypothetical protein ACPG49_03445, partial [Chitinophagales bacterium]
FVAQEGIEVLQKVFGRQQSKRKHSKYSAYHKYSLTTQWHCFPIHYQGQWHWATKRIPRKSITNFLFPSDEDLNARKVNLAAFLIFKTNVNDLTKCYTSISFDTTSNCASAKPSPIDKNWRHGKNNRFNVY